jgi:hypothetical protein
MFKRPEPLPVPLPGEDKIRTAKKGGMMKSKMANKSRKFRSK